MDRKGRWSQGSGWVKRGKEVHKKGRISRGSITIRDKVGYAEKLDHTDRMDHGEEGRFYPKGRVGGGSPKKRVDHKGDGRSQETVSYWGGGGAVGRRKSRGWGMG